MPSGQQSVVGRAGTEPRSIFQAHPQESEFFCIRIPAFSSLCSGFDGRFNSFGPFIFNRFDQAKLVRSLYLRHS